MKQFKYKLISALCLSTLALTGCDDDNASMTSAPPSKASISGTAAIGSPITNAQIDLKCNGYNKTAAATTNAQGQWSANVPPANLPCVTRLTGGMVGTTPNTQTLYSITVGTGTSITTNMTPLSDLILAKTVQANTGSTLDNWYAGTTLAATLNTTITQLAANIATVLSQLTAQGYTLPTGTLNPFSTPFTATTTNSYDQLLEQIGQAIATSSSLTYVQFRTNYLAGTSFPTAPVVTPPTGGATCASISKPKASSSDLTQFVGTYQVKIGSSTTAVPLTIAANGNITLNSQTATASDICGPFVHSNGQGLLILAKKTTEIQVNVFKDNAGKITTEGPDFTSSSGDFFGELGGSTVTPPVVPPVTPPVTPLTQVFSLNTAACAVASADSNMTLYWQCHENVIQDMNLTLKTLTGAPCQLQKVGPLVTVTVGGNSLSDSYNADYEDSVGIPNPTGPLASLERSFTVKTYGGVEINMSLTKDGIFKSVVATQNSPKVQFACLP